MLEVIYLWWQHLGDGFVTINDASGCDNEVVATHIIDLWKFGQVLNSSYFSEGDASKVEQNNSLFLWGLFVAAFYE